MVFNIVYRAFKNVVQVNNKQYLAQLIALKSLLIGLMVYLSVKCKSSCSEGLRNLRLVKKHRKDQKAC